MNDQDYRKRIEALERENADLKQRLALSTSDSYFCDGTDEIRELSFIGKAVFDCSPLAIFIIQDGYFVAANPAALKIFHAENIEDIADYPIIEMIVPDYRDQARERIFGLDRNTMNPPFIFEMKLPGKISAFIESVSLPHQYNGRPSLLVIAQDISDRIKAEMIVKSERDKVRRYLDIASVIFLILGTDGTVRLVNKRGCEILGYREGEILGRDWSELFVPENHRAEVREVFSTLLEDGENTLRFYENSIRTKKGEYRHIAWHNMPLRDENDKVIGVLCSGEDITRYKKAKAELRDSEEKYRTLFDSTDLLLSVYNRDGICQMMNQATAKMFNTTPEECVGKSIEELHPVQGKMFVENFRRIIDSGVSEQHEEEISFPAGKRWLLSNLFPQIDPKGHASTITIVSQDLNRLMNTEAELRKSEETYHGTIDAIEDIVHVIDSDFRFILGNSVFLEWMERVYNETDVYGKSFSELFPHNPEKVNAEYETVFRTGKKMVTEETGIYDGVEYHTETRKIPVIEDGTVTRVITMIRDITENRKKEALLNQAQKMDSIGRLAGGVAHDFNNILTVISGNAELALMELKEEDEFFEEWKEIQSTTRRATQLTRQLLDFSRQRIINPRKTDLNIILLDMNKMLRRLINEGIEFVTLPGENLWDVLVDRGQIGQVLTNLVVNSRDAMPDGGTLTIETMNTVIDEDFAAQHPELPPGEYVIMKVSDTGAGITSDVLPHVFEPFFTTKEKGKGTGLGLSTCYGIVTQNKGVIRIDSELGKGAAVEVYLPRTVKEEIADDVKSEGPSGLAGHEELLLVEDESALRNMVRRVLEKNGYTVHVAEHGEEALRVAETLGKAPDMLVTDVIMPRMGGKELSERLVERFPGVKVLFMSGYTDDAFVNHNVIEENVAFLQKPFTPVALLEKIRSIFDEDDGAVS